MRGKAKAGLVSPSVPCAGSRAIAAFSAGVIQRSAALGTRTLPGRGEAVAERCSGATASMLDAALLPSPHSWVQGHRSVLKALGKS